MDASVEQCHRPQVLPLATRSAMALQYEYSILPYVQYCTKNEPLQLYCGKYFASVRHFRHCEIMTAGHSIAMVFHLCHFLPGSWHLFLLFDLNEILGNR